MLNTHVLNFPSMKKIWTFIWAYMCCYLKYKNSNNCWQKYPKCNLMVTCLILAKYNLKHFKSYQLKLYVMFFQRIYQYFLWIILFHLMENSNLNTYYGLILRQECKNISRGVIARVCFSERMKFLKQDFITNTVFVRKDMCYQ